MEIFLKPGLLYVAALVGMFAHFLKKDIKGETLTAIGDYFKDNLKSTLVAWIGTSVGFVAYITTIATGTQADFLVVFLIGYAFDSLFNKWDAQTAVKAPEAPNADSKPS